MSTFVITWTGGKQEVVTQADAATVEEFVNVHFGSAWETAQESGVTVEQVPDDQEADLITHCADRGVLGGVIQPTPEELPAEDPFEPVLTTEQVPVLTTEQVPVLTTEQVAVITTEQVPVLTTEQVPVLTTEQVAALTTEQI